MNKPNFLPRELHPYNPYFYSFNSAIFIQVTARIKHKDHVWSDSQLRLYFFIVA